jgi:hypothetical protein
MKNQTRVTFQALFENELKLLNNGVCKECDAEIRHPLLPWLVGEKFQETTERVLFVGKPHRGAPEEILPSGIIDPTAIVADELWDWHPPYWSYTREIAETLYGSQAFESIAFTNLIKCTNVGADDGESTSTDKTTYKMAECCVLKLGVIWKEVQRLEPRTVVFYTHGLFPEILEIVPVAIDGTLHEITPRDHQVSCGSKYLRWWERSCRAAWTDTLRLLVVGHQRE